MRDRLRALLSPLALRECRLLFGAQLVSGLGDWAGRLALAVLVFDRSGSTWWTAAVTIVSLLPWLGPGQVLATFADRFGRIQVMVIADIVRALLFVVMLVPMPVSALLLLAFAAGLCVPPFAAARGAAGVDVIPPEQYGASLALFGVASQAELVLGYALGGLVIAAVGAPAALAMNAATFIVSALLLAGLRRTSAARPDTGAALGWAGVRTGLRPWRDDALCRRALVLFVGVNMMMILPEALVVPFADQLDAPDGTVGLLAASIALGSGVAMALSPRSDDHATLLRVGALRAAVLAVIAAALFTASASVAWIGLVALMVSGAVDAIGVPTNQVVGARLPREGRAAAMAVAAGVQYGSQTLAIAVGAAVAVGAGSRAVLAVGSVVAAAIAAWSLLRPPDGPDDWAAPAPDELVTVSPWPPPTTGPTRH